MVVTCLVTVFLCTWVVIHPRIYYTRRLYRTMFKFALFFKAVLAPGLIAVEGLQEWTQCRRMVKDCAGLTEGQFKMIHAFYVNMLALRYRTTRGNRFIWPNQYTWLLQQGLVDWDNQEIRNKSNADSAVKLIAFCQVL